MIKLTFYKNHLGWKKESSGFSSSSQMSLVPEADLDFTAVDPSITLQDDTVDEIFILKPEKNPKIMSVPAFFEDNQKKDTRPLCHYTECITKDDKVCQFPFRYT